MGWVRPGPLAIEPNTYPEGVVVHVYSVPRDRRGNSRLLLVSTAKTAEEATYTAGLAADQTIAAMTDEDDGVCLVAYDGDTGKRMDWHV